MDLRFGGFVFDRAGDIAERRAGHTTCAGVRESEGGRSRFDLVGREAESKAWVVEGHPEIVFGWARARRSVRVQQHIADARLVG